MIYFTAFSFGYTATRLIKTDHEAAEQNWKKSKIGYLCMLIGSEVHILLLLTYFDANSDYLRVRSSYKTTFQQILIFVPLTSY